MNATAAPWANYGGLAQRAFRLFDGRANLCLSQDTSSETNCTGTNNAFFNNFRRANLSDGSLAEFKEILYQQLERLAADVQPINHSLQPHLTGLRVSVVVGVSVYVLLWVVGTVGCVSTLVRVWCLVRRRSVRRPVAGTFIYIGALCVVDLLTTTSILSLISDLLFDGAWLFGAALCPVQMCVEWVGKTLNTYLLTALAFERCVAVRLPHLKALRQSRFATAVTAGVFLLGMLQLLPVYIQSHQMSIPYDVSPTRFLYNTTTRRVQISAAVYWKKVCGFNPSEWQAINLRTYMSWLMGSAFLLPVSIAALLHALTLMGLHGRLGDRQTFKLMINRATRSSFLISTFYLVCLTPHWIITMWALFGDPGTVFQQHPLLEHMLLLLHGVLPVLNSSSNWIIYGAMNKQLGAKLSRSMPSRGVADSQCTDNAVGGGGRCRLLTLKLTRRRTTSRAALPSCTPLESPVSVAIERRRHMSTVTQYAAEGRAAALLTEINPPYRLSLTPTRRWNSHRSHTVEEDQPTSVF